MISLETWMILAPLQKLPKNVGDLGKLIVAKAFKKLPKVQKIVNSGHTGKERDCVSSWGQVMAVCTKTFFFIIIKEILILIWKLIDKSIVTDCEFSKNISTIIDNMV